MTASLGNPRVLRALLLDALRGCDDAVVASLGPFSSWRGLSLLWESGWLGEPRATARATAARIRKALREIAASRRSVGALGQAPSGSRVLLDGRVAAVRGEDLLLENPEGEPPLVLLESARRLTEPGRTAVAVADAVTVLGFADTVPDAAGAAGSPRGLPSRPAIRSGALRPLLLAVR